MRGRVEKVSKIAVLLLLLALVFGFAGISHGAMSMHSEPMAGDCPFAPGAALCDMSVTAHLTAWGEAYVGIPQEGSVLLLFALVAVVCAFAITLLYTHARISDRFVYVRRRTTYIEPPPLLEQLFSNGILHPKLY